LASRFAIPGGNCCRYCCCACLSAFEVPSERLAIFLAYTVTLLLVNAWIVTGSWSFEALWAVLPTGILTVGILHANNLRDSETDTKAGIRTLASVLDRNDLCCCIGFIF